MWCASLAEARPEAAKPGKAQSQEPERPSHKRSGTGERMKATMEKMGSRMMARQDVAAARDEREDKAREVTWYHIATVRFERTPVHQSIFGATSSVSDRGIDCTMAKQKVKKEVSARGPPHIRARLEYLRKAAVYIQSASTSNLKSNQKQNDDADEQMTDDHQVQQAPRTVPTMVGSESSETLNGHQQHEQSVHNRIRTLCLPRQLISQMRGVSLKSQMRLPIDVKRSFCKRCDIILVPGFNCAEKIENASRGGKKPWADVRVVRCTACGTEKRFPRTDRRSKKLPERKAEAATKGHHQHPRDL
ncbi:RNAse P Rpr2/Rpp21 subunit domain protein [Paecilomyces variotii No. 5]|uniref:RNAse P Rpr2/Rpp21 subunit domain protein n=1 Tax=Byssochlamys spectabilis (strain No. 5 / NBRC 109023) TaxID=1356009 RepID=V5HQR2_BYSSN|nr:RNAse P Rpr2/Rpp21 subunit domain protein [Paecilomyces variotii No. 5]